MSAHELRVSWLAASQFRHVRDCPARVHLPKGGGATAHEWCERSACGGIGQIHLLRGLLRARRTPVENHGSPSRPSAHEESVRHGWLRASAGFRCNLRDERTGLCGARAFHAQRGLPRQETPTVEMVLPPWFSWRLERATKRPCRAARTFRCSTLAELRTSLHVRPIGMLIPHVLRHVGWTNRKGACKGGTQNRPS